MEMYSGSCALIGMVRVKWKKEGLWEQRKGEFGDLGGWTLRCEIILQFTDVA